MININGGVICFIIFVVMAFLAGKFSPEAPIISETFLALAVISLLFIPLARRTGKRLDVLKKLVDDEMKK